MTQPKFAPIESADQVRPSYELETPPPWVAHRPGEYRHGSTTGKGLGTPGPDQGYALRLAKTFAGELVLSEGEYKDDAITAAVIVGLRRAAQFGRAPVRSDIELGLTLFGYLGTAPADLVSYRRSVVAGIDHDYRAQRELANSIPTSTLALSPDELRGAMANWQQLTGHVLSNQGG